MVLGVNEYLPKHQQGPEAVILNVSSIAALGYVPQIPIYTATKCAVNGLTRSWGNKAIFQTTKIRVVAVCPGATNTPISNDIEALTLPGPVYDMSFMENISSQE